MAGIDEGMEDMSTGGQDLGFGTMSSLRQALPSGDQDSGLGTMSSLRQELPSGSQESTNCLDILGILSSSSGRKAQHNFAEQSLEIKPQTDGQRAEIVGRYGKIYKSQRSLVMDVVVKKMCCNGGNGEWNVDKLRSVSNEFQAARLAHFAIVPLLGMFADVENKAVYFLFPYLVRGDLWTALLNDMSARLQKDKGKDSDLLCLNQDQRLKIIYHIASAIDFLHNTEVTGFRGAYVHGDITTHNVVLDEGYNARLTNFGQARELSGDGSSAQYQLVQKDRFDELVEDDCFKFGVVLLEVLITLEMIPERERLLDLAEKDIQNVLSANVSTKVQEMKDKCKDITVSTPEDIFGKLRKNSIWQVIEYKEVQAAEVVQAAAIKCLDGSKYRPRDVLEDMMEEKLLEGSSNRWSRKSTNPGKCDVCMLHDAIDTIYQGKHDLCEEFKVCVACMRNANFNPIRCHSCQLEDQEALPHIGGNGWGAILIAGYDSDEGFAKCHVNDVNLMRDTISSPNVMGLRKELIKCVYPSKEGQGDLKTKDQIKREFDALRKQAQVETLVLFFSGHYDPRKGFRLRRIEDDSDYYMTRKEMVEEFDKCTKVKKYVIFLDCCDGPDLREGNLKNVPFLQMNTGQEAKNVKDLFSPFTQCLVQFLSSGKFTGPCLLTQSRKNNIECEICPDYKSTQTDLLVSFFTLNEYVNRHMIQYHNNLRYQTSTFIGEQKGHKDYKVAYHMEIRPKIDLHFHSNHDEKASSGTRRELHRESNEASQRAEAGQLPDRAEADIERYLDQMPPDIKTGYIDVMILYAEEDRAEADQFRQHLIDTVQLKNHGPVKALLYDSEEFESLSRSKIRHLEETWKRSTFVFMYLTKAFVEDTWLNYVTEAFVMASLNENSWCVIPVSTEKRPTSFDFPLALTFLTPIIYCENREGVKTMSKKDGVKRLIDGQVSVRVTKNENLKLKQKEWVEQRQLVETEMEHADVQHTTTVLRGYFKSEINS